MSDNKYLKEINPKCKKIRAGKYEYRGWIIKSVGYYPPDQKIGWEGIDPETNCADFLEFTKRDVKIAIDKEISMKQEVSNV